MSGLLQPPSVEPVRGDGEESPPATLVATSTSPSEPSILSTAGSEDREDAPPRDAHPSSSSPASSPGGERLRVLGHDLGNSTQVTLTGTAHEEEPPSGGSTPAVDVQVASPVPTASMDLDLDPPLPPSSSRVDTGDTRRGPLLHQQTLSSLGSSPTVVVVVPTTRTTTTTTTMAMASANSTPKKKKKKMKTAPPQTTTTTTAASQAAEPPEPRRSWFRRVRDAVRGWYHRYGMQSSMVGLALLGLLTAVAHHLYNASLHGRRVEGDPQWPPRYGSALAFFVKAILIASVHVAYKQQAWLAVKEKALKVSTLDAIFSVYYDPLQFASFEFLVRTWLPAILAIISWALPLCAIASPSTLTSESGYETTAASCPGVPVLDFSRENGYTLDGADDDLSGLANWNIRRDGDYYYDQPSAELRRLFTLSTLSTAGPLQPANPCPAGTNCTYHLSFPAAAYGCEARDEFGGAGRRLSRSDLVPGGGSLLYAGYSSLPMGAEDEDGAPLAWAGLGDGDASLGVFTGLPSLWLGWCTRGAAAAAAAATDDDDDSTWADLEAHVAECRMYNATYSFDVLFASGEMSLDNSRTELHGLLLPEGETKRPNATDYMEFGSYHATGVLLRNLLSGNVTLAHAGDPAAEYAITWTSTTQTPLLDPSTQLPTAGDGDLAAAAAALHRDVFVSMLSDAALHDRRRAPGPGLPCRVTTAVQVWRYEPLWLALPYGLAVGATLLALLAGAHGFAGNGYAADACFSTFVATSRSRDLDALARGAPGACLGRWPKDERVLASRLRFGEVERPGGEEEEEEEGEGEGGGGGGGPGVPHAAFAFPESVRRFDRRKKYGQEA